MRKNKLVEKEGMYEISCIDFDARDKQAAPKQLNKHKNTILVNNRTTCFSEQCNNYNNFFSANNVKLLFNTQKGTQMDLLDIIQIKNPSLILKMTPSSRVCKNLDY